MTRRTDLIPPTGPVTSRRLLAGHVLPLPLAMLAGALTADAWSLGDGTAPLLFLAAFGCLFFALGLFLQLLVRYATDPALRRACAVAIAGELLGWHLDPAHFDPAVFDQVDADPAAGTTGVQGEGGGRS